MTIIRNRRVLLTQSPTHKLSTNNFALDEAEVGPVQDGELLLATRYLSIDAANRAWMQSATYRSKVEAGTVMAGGGLSEVIVSKSPDFTPGELVFADCGWQEFSIVPAAEVERLPAMTPQSHLLSVYGIAGLTAYFGLLRAGEPKAGETVVVSAAAGSVGSLAGQIAKLKGCRVVGIAGGADKCAWLVDELGFDAAVDYKAQPVAQGLKAAVPDGIDVFFDNVGGDIFEACLLRMRQYGRIACCGAVSQYDGATPAHGPRGVPGLFVVRRLIVRGFIVSDFAADYDTARVDLKTWVESGELTVREDIIEGLENAPDALIGLLSGANRGKRMIKLS